MANADGPLKRYRRLKGISLSQMAEALDVDKSTLGRIDSGKQWPSKSFLERAIDYTGGAVTPNDLLPVRAEAQAEATAA